MGPENTESRTADTVPVIASDAIDILLHDHQRIRALARALPAAVGSKRETILESLKEILTLHNATEENLIYPAISELARRPLHAFELSRETFEGYELMWQLSMMSLESPAFEDKALKFQQVVEAHIRTEEESELPYLRDASDTEGLAKLSSAVQAFRERFH